MNGDKDSLDELDDSRKEDKNGFKAKFMFNIADGGFTGEQNEPAQIKEEVSTYCNKLAHVREE